MMTFSITSLLLKSSSIKLKPPVNVWSPVVLTLISITPFASLVMLFVYVTTPSTSVSTIANFPSSSTTASILTLSVPSMSFVAITSESTSFSVTVTMVFNFKSTSESSGPFTLSDCPPDVISITCWGLNSILSPPEKILSLPMYKS